MASITQTLVTPEEFDRLPEDSRFELWDGEVIEMASATPEHGFVVLKLGASITVHMEHDRSGFGLADIEFEVAPTRRLRPDIAILTASKWAQIDVTKVPVTIMPDIAIEVISPSESARHLERKVAAYLKAGVLEVWLIHTDPQRIYIHTAGGVRLARTTETLTSDILPGWSQPVAALFPAPAS